MQSRQDPAVQYIYYELPRMIFGLIPIYLRIQRIKSMCIRDRIDHFGLSFGHDLPRKPFAIPWCAIGQQSPSERIRPILVDDFPGINAVAFAL
ncbi:hypothetical protein D3C84_956390 [compost metagenome]